MKAAVECDNHKPNDYATQKKFAIKLHESKKKHAEHVGDHPWNSGESAARDLTGAASSAG